ncbi:MAG: hypothetical protein Q8N23_16330 [Archangium sp.]|nr:hypothetical protein [Archangium sp.]MDP3575933.1 hypothetical protein [Archangium sp.]
MTHGRRWAAAAVLAGLTALAYSTSLTSPFTHYDDPLYIWDNLTRMAVPGWKGLALQFDSTRSWSGEFVEFFPLRDAVYWGLYQAFQLDPFPFHLASLVFHIISSLLLWRFFTLIGLPRQVTWLGALLFALHPVHIESVVWIAGMKDPMALMFILMGLCAYASYRERPAPWKYALTMFGLCCAFMVKSIAVAMPVIMLAMELWIGTRAKWSLIALRLWGFFVVAGIFFMMILGIGRANHVLVGPHGGTWATHAVIVAWAQVKYLKQALLPTSYRLIYCFEPPTGLLDWRLWVGVALLLAVLALAWRWRREPLRLFLMSFYVLAILPVSNLVPFPAIMADRYLYVPTVGTCGLLAIFAAGLQPRLFRVVTVAVALLLTTATATRAALWQDEESLWEEPDLDPACVTDTSFPAAQSHILRFFTTKDRTQGLLALERALVTPGLRGVSTQMVCTTIIAAAQEAHELGADARALSFARLATTQCPAYAQAWNAAMVVSLHKRPVLAAGAATKAWRLQKTPETEVLMWLTRLEIDDATALPQILRLSQLKDELVCMKIAQFATDAPQLAPGLGEANFNCAPYLPSGPPAPPGPAPK